MATSANKNTNPAPDSRPTGDLEYLFRQRLGEAEVPPRLPLWEQLDHDLLVQQNEAYRRRLVTYRWLAAACVLLMLGIGGWAGLRRLAAPTSGPAELATRQKNTQSIANQSIISPGYANASGATGGRNAATGPLPVPAGVGAYNGAGSTSTTGLALLTRQGVSSRAGRDPRLADQALVPTFFPSASSPGGYLPETMNSLTMRMALLSGYSYNRPDTLKPELRAAPPVLATTQAAPSESEKSVASAKRWRFGGSYATTAFNPNINFSQAGAATSGYASANSAANKSADAYEAGAAEYRHNLRAGVGQRAALTAALAPAKHWVLTAGVEVAEYRASSETSYVLPEPTATAFTGNTAATYAYNNAADFSLVRPIAYNAPPRTTNYRYRTVGVPVSARYGSGKSGVSLYAKVGAAVDLLLGSRVEVADAPSATRDYSLRSADSPYRRVVATVRGGGGVQYRPAGANWALLVGPTAEAGLTTLNNNPAQALLSRARPYAVGLEASVEFGGGAAAPSGR